VTEGDRTTKNGKAHGAAEGIAEGIAESVEGLAAIARTQAEETFKQGEKAEPVLRDGAIASIRAVEEVGLSLLSTFAEVSAPITPKLPSNRSCRESQHLGQIRVRHRGAIAPR
jgi:hypothetical protein